MRKEVKTISGFPDYAITRDGRVWSKARIDKQGGHRKGIWLKSWDCGTGHLCVLLDCFSKKYIHRLVLETFVGPCPPGMECRHLDGNPANNRLDNLAWGTHSENSQDSIQHGTHSCLRRGSANNRAKLTEDKVRVIRYLRDVAKFTYADLAWQFDVTWDAIWRICKRKNWSHI